MLRLPLSVEQEYSEDFMNFRKTIYEDTEIKFEQIGRFYNTNTVSCLGQYGNQILALDTEGGIQKYRPIFSEKEKNFFSHLETFM